MKHYKIINDNKLQTGSGKSFIGLSYNVSWEAMTSNTEGRFKVCSKLGEGVCKMNILENIKYNLNKYNPDFLTFQEAAEYEDIIDLIKNEKKDLFNFYINTSGKEHMLTCWNNNNFSLVKAVSGEFEEGRPFVILILKVGKIDKNIVLINLHAGHYINTQRTIFDIINKTIKENISYSLRKSINRVIMSGDFNRNISEDATSDYIIKFINDTNEFKLKRSFEKKATCCSVLGNDYGFNYDHIVDSKNKIEKKILGTTSKSYKIPSSDHILIIVKI